MLPSLFCVCVRVCVCVCVCVCVLEIQTHPQACMEGILTVKPSCQLLQSVIIETILAAMGGMN